MSTPNTVRAFFHECRLLLQHSNAIRLQCAAMRNAATEQGVDWSQLKALASADIADEEKGDGKKVAKLIEKADFACAYADMLGLRKDERESDFRSSTPTNSKPVAAVPSRSSSGGEATGSSPVASSNSQSVAVTIPGDSDGESASPINPSIPDTPDRAALSTIPTDDPYNSLPAFLDRADA